MVSPNSKAEESAPEPSLIEASNRHEKKDINKGEAGLLVEQEPTQFEDVPVGNSPTEILSSDEVSEMDRQESVDNVNLNVPPVDWTEIYINFKN